MQGRRPAAVRPVRSRHVRAVDESRLRGSRVSRGDTREIAGRDARLRDHGPMGPRATSLASGAEHRAGDHEHERDEHHADHQATPRNPRKSGWEERKSAPDSRLASDDDPRATADRRAGHFTGRSTLHHRLNRRRVLAPEVGRTAVNRSYFTLGRLGDRPEGHQLLAGAEPLLRKAHDVVGRVRGGASTPAGFAIFGFQCRPGPRLTAASSGRGSIPKVIGSNLSQLERMGIGSQRP
jgi:hypothetical protein